MQKARLHMRRFDPLLRAALVLYLLTALFLVAAHQHHGGLQGHDCSLCTAAHTPATEAQASVPLALPTSTDDVLPIPGDQGWASESPGSTRTRAPPLV